MLPTDSNRGRTGEKAKEKTRDKILGLIRVNPDISMEAMASSLGLTRKGVEWQIRKLKASHSPGSTYLATNNR